MRLWNVLVLMMIVGACAQAQQMQRLAPDTTLRIGQLNNGLTYYIQQHHEPQQRAELRLVVKAGSLQEEADQLGVAHFVEHMAFNGTTHFARNELIDFIEQSGSRFGADLNASTSFAETIYKLQVQTDSLALLEKGLLVLEDWASGLTFDSLEVEKERGIVISEWRSRLSSNQRIEQERLAVLLQGSRYADRFPIGSPELIDTVARQRLVDYYQGWYRPEMMAVVAVGDFEVEWMENQIRDRFGKLPASSSPIQAGEYQLSTAPRRSFRTATDREAPYTRWSITYQLSPAPIIQTEEDLYQSLLYRLYNAMLNARLAELKEKTVPPFTFAYSGFGQLPGKYRSYELNGFTTIDNLEASLAVVIEETQRVRLHGFTPNELKQQKTEILESYRRYVREYDKVSSAQRANIYLESFLNSTYPKDLNPLVETLTRALDRIELREVEALSELWLQAEVATHFLSSSDQHRAALPDQDQWFNWVDSLFALQVPAYQAAETGTELLTLETKAGEATLIDYDSILQLSTYELSNGVRLFLKPTEFKNDEILVRAISPGGMSLYPDEDWPSARHSIPIQSESGLGEFSASALDRVLAGKQVRLGASMTEYTEGLGGSSTRADLETLFQLIQLQFTAPRFDSIILENYRIKRKEIMERIDQDPRSEFGRMVIDRKYDFHPRRPNLSAAEFENIKLERAIHIYQERFANAADFDFVFVGNFSTDSLLALAKQYLATLPASEEQETWKDSGLRLFPGTIDTLVIKGQTPKAEVMLDWHSPFDYQDQVERYHFTALRRLLDIRLREQLREELGGVYGVRLSARFRARPDTFAFVSVRFNCEPDQVDTLISRIHQEMNAIAAGEIDPDNLSKIQNGQLKAYEEALRTNNFWLGQLVNRLDTGRPFTGLYPGKYEALVEQLDSKILAEQARRYILAGYHFQFVLLPDKTTQE